MVSLSFSSFMLVIVLFIFLTIKDTIAHTDHQAKQTFVALKTSHLSVEKEVLEGVPASAEITNGKTGGRKMMMMKIEIKNKKEKMKQVREESSGAASASRHSVGNLNIKGQGKLREMSSKSSSSSSTGSFVALNADYHMARPHPPKNN